MQTSFGGSQNGKRNLGKLFNDTFYKVRGNMDDRLFDCRLQHPRILQPFDRISKLVSVHITSPCRDSKKRLEI